MSKLIDEISMWWAAINKNKIKHISRYTYRRKRKSMSHEKEVSLKATTQRTQNWNKNENLEQSTILGFHLSQISSIIQCCGGRVTKTTCWAIYIRFLNFFFRVKFIELSFDWIILIKQPCAYTLSDLV